MALVRAAAGEGSWTRRLLGRGGTRRCCRSRGWGEAFGLPRLYTKAEGLNPTGSFKARGMSAAVSRNAELGATSFIAPSAGNAAGALAAYGAAAGVGVTVVVPVDAPPASRDEALAMGARLVLVEGLISDCGRVASALAEPLGAFDVSTLKEPYRVEGKKTMGLELAEQRGWRLPDVIVYPTGGGTGLVGMWKAFDELETLGFIGPERPRMIAVQAEGCAPIVRAFEAGERFARPFENARTRAAGLRVPSAVGDFLILSRTAGVRRHGRRGGRRLDHPHATASRAPGRGVREPGVRRRSRRRSRTARPRRAGPG